MDPLGGKSGLVTLSEIVSSWDRLNIEPSWRAWLKRLCRLLWWRKKHKNANSARKSELDPSWAAAPSVREPDEEEYYEALRRNFAKDRQQERRLRTLAWWKRNDSFRHLPRHGEVSASGLCRDNLNALVQLLNEANENDRISKAELLRELGKFDAAKEVLSRVTSSQYSSVVRQLRDLCNRGDSCVRLLSFEESQDLEALIQLLQKNNDRAKRLAAIHALERMGPYAKSAIYLLLELLQDKDVEIAFAAKDALCEIGDWLGQAFPVLIELLRSDRHMIRGMAAKLLGEMGSPAKAATPVLRIALADESVYVRTFAERALRAIEAGSSRTS